MAKLLTIFGITGQQGTSIVNNVLGDPKLSKTYKIRGVTRDTSKPEAKALEAKGIEIVKGDAGDRASIESVLNGAHTVFAMTATIYAPGGDDRETVQGKAIADAAVAAGVQLLIYSTVPSPNKISKGKYPVGMFDCKDAVKDYIETLPIKSAFFSPGSFMQNYHTHMAPRAGPDGNLAMTSFVSPDTQMALIDIAGDTGKYVGAILADPEKYTGKTFCAATRIYTMTEIVDIMTKASGKTIKYNQVSKDVFAGFLPEASRTTMLNMLSYFEEFGYFGAETKELVHWAATNAHSSPTTFEDFLKRDPLQV